MKKIFSCPGCGAELLFRSNVTIFVVCEYCQASVVRHDLDLENLGKMAELPDDMSPLQIGTSGQFGSSFFSLIGRSKIQWSEGIWNEWICAFDTGKIGWLAEAQGFYAMSFLADSDILIPDKKSLKIGQNHLFGKVSFEIEDMRTVTCISAEGELPQISKAGRKSLNVDFTGDNGAFACLEYEETSARLFLGHYAEFQSFGFTGLREIDGW